MKPIQAAIESLHAKDLCPRLHVDVTHADAVCPDFVRDQWKEQLVIDLDPGYPLDLAFTDVGVEADLSFGGYVSRCVFPWAAIYIVGERGTGRGQVFASNIPESLRHKFGAPQVPTIDPKLTEVRDDVRARKTSRRRKRRGAEAEAEAEVAVSVSPLPALGVVQDDGEEDTSALESTGDDEAEAEGEAAEDAEDAEKAPTPAQTRRSAFKVIDGGG